MVGRSIWFGGPNISWGGGGPNISEIYGPGGPNISEIYGSKYFEMNGPGEQKKGGPNLS